MGDTTQTASLLGCPEDVSHIILRYLCRGDLRNICLSHSRLRALAETYLYSEIHFGWQEYWPHPLTDAYLFSKIHPRWQEYRPHPITTLLRSILRRPQLAAYIRRVSLVGDSFDKPHFVGKAPKIPVSEPVLEEILAFVAETRVSYRETWLDELRSGTMEAFVAILLCQTPHLTDLFIGADFAKESRIIGLVLRSTLCETRDYGLGLNLGHLKSVSFERYLNEKTYQVVRNTADVLPLFYIPSVTQISAAIENPVKPASPLPSATFSWPAAHPPSCPNLRSLKITHMREPYLGQLLSVANRVQSIDWVWFYNPKLQDEILAPVIDLAQFTTAISQHSSTLEELVISTECYYGGDIELPQLTIASSFKAIVDFDKLRKFTAPFALLVGFLSDTTKHMQEFLPRNLEFLTITDDLYHHEQYEWGDRDILSVLESWLENFQASTPHLRGIALFLRLMDDTWNQPIRNELQELCARVGIQLEITKLNEDM